MKRFTGCVKIVQVLRVDMVMGTRCIMWRISLVLWNLYVH